MPPLASLFRPKEKTPIKIPDNIEYRITVLEQNEHFRKEVEEGNAILVGGHEVRFYNNDSHCVLIFGAERENRVWITLTKSEKDKFIKFISK